MRPLILLVLLTLTLLSSSCAGRQPVILDHSLPHRLAQDTDMLLRLRLPDGSYASQLTHVPADSWVFPAELIHE